MDVGLLEHTTLFCSLLSLERCMNRDGTENDIVILA